MAEEPVKIKMTLRAARPSVQGAAPPTPSAQAAINAVEARWRAEDKKVKKERRKKGFVGCLSWLVILLALFCFAQNRVTKKVMVQGG